MGATGKCSRTPKEAENRTNNTRTEQFKRLKAARNINEVKDKYKYKPKKKVNWDCASVISRVCLWCYDQRRGQYCGGGQTGMEDVDGLE